MINTNAETYNIASSVYNYKNLQIYKIRLLLRSEYLSQMYIYLVVIFANGTYHCHKLHVFI